MPEHDSPVRFDYDARNLDSLLRRVSDAMPGGGALRVVLDGADSSEKAQVSERLAQARRLKFERVDLGPLTAKGIGETERALPELFRHAEVSGALLLFDEADALFGRRSAAADAQDRYANLETSFLAAMRRFPGTTVISLSAPLSRYPRLAKEIDVAIDFWGGRQAGDGEAGDGEAGRPVTGTARRIAAAWEEPLNNRHFLVLIGDLEVGFCRVSGFTSQSAMVESSRSGGARTDDPKSRGALGYGNLVLGRALSRSKDLYYWRHAIIEGKDDRRTVELWQLPAPRAKPVNRWRFTGCWPCRWTGPEFDAIDGDLAYEELELCYDRFDWI